MEKVYVQLIMKGKKTYKEVPEKLKKQFKGILIEYQREELIKGE